MKGLNRRRPANDSVRGTVRNTPDTRPSAESFADFDSAANSHAARARVVNRTHRVIRDEALRMRQQREVSRSLWAPVGISSALLLVICYAIWGLLVEYDLTPSSIPDASDQMLFLLLLWSLPVAVVVLGLIWFRRHRGAADNIQGPRA